MKVKLMQDKPRAAYDDVEYVNRAVSTLEPYFKKIVAHQSPIAINIAKYTAYFYTYRVAKDEGRDSLPVIKVASQPTWRPSAFFDSTGHEIHVSELVSMGFSKDSMYRLYLDDKPCGFLIADSNVLIASDWTHAYENMSALNAIISELTSRKLLNPVPTKSLRKKLSIKLGCDPELEQLATPDGYTVVSPTVNHSTSAPIGVDGSGAQIELRPEPSAMPETIVNRIKGLIAQLPPVGILGNRHPLGGHIHIGGIKPDRTTLKLLDDFVGKLSTKTAGSARGSYNGLSAYETKPYGFEYRSPASTWLHNPEIARIMFKLVKNVVTSAYSDDGIEYELDSTGVPTLASYEKVLTTDEAIEFLAFHKNYKQVSRPINYNWGVNPVVPRVSRITFRDDWPNSTVQAYFSRAFMDLSYDYPLYFYGLRADRGRAVANFEVEGFETIYHNPHPDGGGFWFGIPAEIRDAYPTSMATIFIDRAGASITKILKGGTYTDIDPNAITNAPLESPPVGIVMAELFERIRGAEVELTTTMAAQTQPTTSSEGRIFNVRPNTPAQTDYNTEDSDLCPEGECNECDSSRTNRRLANDTMAETTE